ncbi:MAG: L-alanine-DL-glutamate epimerase-like enolase superfamily enzyme [Paracoccaceae bacterium]
MRKATSGETRITIDPNGFWNYDRALKTMRKLERYDLECVEQPLPHWDIEGMARLRQQIGTPVLADESARELHHLREIIERRAADGLFIKLQKASGFLKSQRWLTMARLANMSVMSGCMIGSGLECSPSAHLMVANRWAAQFVHENPFGCNLRPKEK